MFTPAWRILPKYYPDQKPLPPTVAVHISCTILNHNFSCWQYQMKYWNWSKILYFKVFIFISCFQCHDFCYKVCFNTSTVLIFKSHSSSVFHCVCVCVSDANPDLLLVNRGYSEIIVVNSNYVCFVLFVFIPWGLYGHHTEFLRFIILLDFCSTWKSTKTHTASYYLVINIDM